MSSYSDEAKYGCLVMAIVLLIAFLAIGPAAIQRYFSSWKASSYGADWLIVQYTVDGKVLNYWKLRGSSVGSEQGSDGIYFPDESGNIVHISGTYVYVQVSNWAEAERRFLRGAVAGGG